MASKRVLSAGRRPSKWMAVCLVTIGSLCTGITWAQEQRSRAPAATTAPAQTRPSAPAGESRDERLARIEAQLRDLTGALEELRKTRANAARPPTTDTVVAAAANATPKTSPTTIPTTLPSSWLNALSWRSIGPANMAGRIVDLAVVESDPSTYWVATASGGLLKTTNNGVTFSHQFDKEETVAIGAIAVSQSDPKIVWVGTGENNPRNSVSYGDGVYKSTDGGATWKNMGLKKTFQIGRIAIHHTNPNIVYVGALGRLYGPNEERGVFKTTDGGVTWQRVLYIDDKTGVIDLQMHPTEPDTLLAAAWERKRDGYDTHPGGGMADGYDTYDPIIKWGKGSGIYKTVDGGKTWRKRTMGLPSSPMGRIGLDYYRKDPNIIFAIVDCEKIGMGTPPRTGTLIDIDISGQETEQGVKITSVREGRPSERAGLREDDVIQAADGKAITKPDQLTEAIRAHKVGEKIKYKVRRGDKVLDIEVTLERREQFQGDPSADFTSAAGGGGGGRGGGRQRGGERSTTRGASTQASTQPSTQPAAYAGVTGESAEGGVRLTNVMQDSPAEKAGMKTGDVIEAIGDKPIKQYDQLLAEIRAAKPNDKVKVKLKTGDESREVELVLAERPQVATASTPSRTRPSGGIYGGQIENVQDDQGPNSHEYGGIYKSMDGGDTWTRINSLNPRPMYFSIVKVDPSDERYLYVLGVSMYRSEDGGKTMKSDAGRGIHADQHQLWINPKDGRHMIVGTDGGHYVSYDRTANWDHLNTMAIGQFYHVAIAPRQPYHVTGGLQDNGTWLGPAITLDGVGPINEDWVSVGGGDGFMTRVDPEDPYLVYGESQNGTMFRRNLRTGERASIRPRPPEGAPPYKFNWNTPFILSSHNPRIFYCAGNYVFRSFDRGNNLSVISPELPGNKWGTATALAESPRNPDILYVGTDDGQLWVTRDGGKKWDNVQKNLGLSKPMWVSTIEVSRFAEGRAYVVLDGHRSDDDQPYVLMTEDHGKTWKSLRANLPWGSTRCLREDLQNQDLLYLGTEFTAWCSLDRGKQWHKLGAGLPTVAVHEFALHPNNGEIVAGTHGRSLWALDVTPLRQMKAEQFAAKPMLYQPSTVTRWRAEPLRGRTNRRFVGQNPPRGANIYYSLPQGAQKASLKVVDITGATLREIPAKAEAGLHRVTWDLRPTPQRGEGGGGGGRGGGAGVGQGRERRSAADAPAPPSPTTRTTATTRPTTRRSTTQFAERGGGRGGFPGIAAVPAGTYRLVLTVDDQPLAQTLKVEADPILPESISTLDLPTEEEDRAWRKELEQEWDRLHELHRLLNPPEVGY